MRAARIHTEALVTMATEAAKVSAETASSLAACRDEVRALRNELAHASAVSAGNHERTLAISQHEFAALRDDLAVTSETAASNHERNLLALRMVRDDDASARAALWSARSTPGYAAAFEEDEPLVTVLITTYLNWPLLRDRSLPSVLAQTYERWQAIVIGDAAPDDARHVVESFGDERIRFVNLPYRGPYPVDARAAWQISGTTPWNTGLALAEGRWIASNSDDDALRPDHLESLLRHARKTRAEVPYGYIDMRLPDGPGERLGAFPPFSGQWNMQASLLHAGLGFLPLQSSDWVFDIPNDVSLLERMLRIGVRFSMLEEPVVDIYPSRMWSEREQGRLIQREQF